jgi:hypothetical protein
MRVKVNPEPNPIVNSTLSVMLAFGDRMRERKKPSAIINSKPSHPPSKGTNSIGSWETYRYAKTTRKTASATAESEARTFLVVPCASGFEALLIAIYWVPLSIVEHQSSHLFDIDPLIR